MDSHKQTDLFGITFYSVSSEHFSLLVHFIFKLIFVIKHLPIN